MKKSKMFIYLISFISIIILIFLLIKLSTNTNFGEGEIKSDLTLLESKSLMDSAFIGLTQYKNKFNHYPKVNGKYFFDSIKMYLSDLSPYVYLDDSDSVKGNYFRTTKLILNKSNYMKISNTFLGAGNEEYYISYNYYDSAKSFMLYFVGLNGVDEQGKGDDIIWKQ